MLSSLRGPITSMIIYCHPQCRYLFYSKLKCWKGSYPKQMYRHVLHQLSGMSRRSKAFPQIDEDNGRNNSRCGNISFPSHEGIGVGTSEKVERGKESGGTIQDHEWSFEIPPLRGKILLSREGEVERRQFPRIQCMSTKLPTTSIASFSIAAV